MAAEHVATECSQASQSRVATAGEPSQPASGHPTSSPAPPSGTSLAANGVTHLGEATSCQIGRKDVGRVSTSNANTTNQHKTCKRKTGHNPDETQHFSSSPAPSPPHGPHPFHPVLGGGAPGPALDSKGDAVETISDSPPSSPQPPSTAGLTESQRQRYEDVWRPSSANFFPPDALDRKSVV
jgi:hypothetical protein